MPPEDKDASTKPQSSYRSPRWADTVLGRAAISLAATLVGMAVSERSASAPPMHLKGRWSIVPDSLWRPNGAGATHMIVLRGNADSTRVLHFHDNHDPVP